MKFSTKLIVLILFIIAISVGTISTISYRTSEASIISNIKQNLELSAMNLMQSVDRFIYERYNDTEMIINDVFLNSELISVDKNKILRDYLVHLTWYDSLSISDMNGKIIYSSNSKKIGNIVKDEYWFKDTLNNFINASDYINSSGNGKPTLIFSNTIVDKFNNKEGILFGSLSWSTISEIIDNNPQEVEVFILDEDEKIIARSSNLYHKAVDSSRLTTDSNYLIIRVFSDGYLGYKSNGWSLIMRVPKTTALAPLNKILYSIIVTSLLVAACVIFMGTIVSHLMSQPIKKLLFGVSRIEKGDLNYKINMGSKDEFGFLASNFDEMTNHLKLKTVELENAVKDLRTKSDSLAGEKSRLQAILDVTGDGILMQGENGRVTVMNKNIVQFFGNQTSKLATSNDDTFQSILAEQFGIENTHAIYAKANEDSAINKTITIENPYKIIFVLSMPIKAGDDNKQIGRAWVFRDLTKEKDLEKTRDRFISVASHKLRTPLTNIRWGAEFLKEDTDASLDEKKKKFIDIIYDNTLRLTSLVNILLNASSIINDQVLLKKDKFCLNKVVKDVIQRYDSSIQSKKLDLRTPNLSDNEINVELDKSKIDQVMQAVIENAINYSPKEGIIIIDIKKDSENITVQISDNGIGIDDKEKNKIFTKFFRGEKAQLMDTEGSGLSLYLCKVIVETSGGEIWFQSEEDKGTTFFIKLPLK